MKKLSISALVISIIALGIAIYAMTGGLSGAGTFVTSSNLTAPTSSTESVTKISTPNVSQPISGVSTTQEVFTQNISLNMADDTELAFKLTAMKNFDGDLIGATVTNVSGSAVAPLIQQQAVQTSREETLQSLEAKVETSDIRKFRIQIEEFWKEALLLAGNQKAPGYAVVWFKQDYLGKNYSLEQEDTFAKDAMLWILTVDWCDFHPDSLICLPDYEKN